MDCKWIVNGSKEEHAVWSSYLLPPGYPFHCVCTCVLLVSFVFEVLLAEWALHLSAVRDSKGMFPSSGEESHLLSV